MSTAMSDPSCAISIFFASLKTYDDGEPENSPSTIIGFDLKILTAECFGSSPCYDSSLSGFDVLAWEMLKKERWVCRPLLNSVVVKLASLHGWMVKKNQHFIQCNRFGEPDENTTRNFVSGELKNGCTIQLSLTSVEPSF